MLTTWRFQGSALSFRNYCVLRLSEVGKNPFVLVFAESLASWIGGGTLQFLTDCGFIFLRSIDLFIFFISTVHV